LIIRRRFRLPAGRQAPPYISLATSSTPSTNKKIKHRAGVLFFRGSSGSSASLARRRGLVRCPELASEAPPELRPTLATPRSADLWLSSLQASSTPINISNKKTTFGRSFI